MRKISDFETYVDNPSKPLEGDLKHVHHFTKGAIRKLVNEYGEEKLFSELGDEVNKVVDSREYRKIFVSELVTLKDLNSSGIKVLCYILKHLRIKKDDITISISECMEFTGYKSKVNVYNGLAELLEKQIIFRKVGIGSYYINVNTFYNGSRL